MEKGEDEKWRILIAERIVKNAVGVKGWNVQAVRTAPAADGRGSANWQSAAAIRPMSAAIPALITHPAAFCRRGIGCRKKES